MKNTLFLVLVLTLVLSCKKNEGNKNEGANNETVKKQTELKSKGEIVVVNEQLKDVIDHCQGIRLVGGPLVA